MGHRSDPTFLVLHALKLKGFTDGVAVAELTGLPIGNVDQELAALAEAGLASRREGRVCGWALTPAGRLRHADLLAADCERSGVHDVLTTSYVRFSDLNTRFKELCTDWQLRRRDADQVPNDHRDAAYDRFVIDGLIALDGEVQPVCGGLGQALDRMAGYGPRLGRALGRLRAGDRDGFTRPLANSYHDIWMELHEDMITTLGLVRTAADA